MAAPRRIFVDTSAWYTLANQASPDHEGVREALLDPAASLVTSTYVLDEVLTLVQMRRGHGAAVHLGERVRDPAVCRLERVTAADEDAAWVRFRERPDQGYSFTDCTSFVLMERLGIRVAAALDGDFAREGFGVVPRT